MLRQDQFAFDEHTVLDTVIMGHARLHALRAERDAIYAKPELSEEDGNRVGELEAEFGELGGYEAESEASVLLSGLGIPAELGGRTDEEASRARTRCGCCSPRPSSTTPTSCCWTSRRTTWTCKSITWLEEFLSRFTNTVVIVSHDRHFLNQVCTHVADIDFQRIQVYVGNYDFWYQASQLHLRQRQSENAKTSAKVNDLKAFIQRFSSNASKARQATSRKQLLEKLTLEDMPISSRKYPYITFTPERPCGDVILEIKHLAKKVDGAPALADFSLTVAKGDRIAFVGDDALARTTLFRILAGELEPDSGHFRWGVTIRSAYFPKENAAWFDNDLSLVEWLRQFTPPAEGESFARGFLGRMLFSGDEALKKTSVLSGGERVRCMLSRMMLANANVLILDEPTNHLDLETITALNNALAAFPEVLLFASRDHELVSTLANRIIEITPDGVIDRRVSFDEYLEERARALAGEEPVALSA